MFGIKVPILTVVLGEGGSGGALAIGCGNKMLMMENAVFYVARYLSSVFPFFPFFLLSTPLSHCLNIKSFL